MWFKNIKLYKFSKPFTVNTDTLQSDIETMQFRSCSTQEIQSMGFVPLIPGSEQLFHADENAIAFSLQIEDKILPASVVNAELQAKVEVIQQETGSPVSKKAQKELKEDIVNGLLPRAFTKRSRIQALLLRKEQLILVESSSDKQAETLLACLRKCLNSLPVLPLVKSGQQQTLTQWLMQDAPDKFELLDEAEFKSADDEGATIKVKKHDLDAEEVLAHVQAGKWVEKLAINFNDRLSCLIAEDVSIKRVKYSDELKEENQDIPKDEVGARFDADFALFSAEMSEFSQALVSIFDEQ